MIPRHLQIAIAVLVVSVFALGFYLVHLKRRVEQSAPPVADARPVAPPVAGPAEPLQLYLAYDDEGGLRKRQARAALPNDRGERAREVLRALLAAYQENPSVHPLGAGADIRDVYLVSDSLAVVDTNSAFADGHRSGILVEELTLASVVRTMAANVPGITRVKFLVDGKERETLAGHADLSGFYELGAISDAIKEIE